MRDVEVYAHDYPPINADMLLWILSKRKIKYIIIIDQDITEGAFIEDQWMTYDEAREWVMEQNGDSL